jgi:hypothetical protein
MSLTRLRWFTRFSMSLTPLPLRSGSVPAREFTHPRLFVWGPWPQTAWGERSRSPTPPSKPKSFARGRSASTLVILVSTLAPW